MKGVKRSLELSDRAVKRRFVKNSPYSLNEMRDLIARGRDDFSLSSCSTLKEFNEGSIRNLTTKDYIYCETCQMYVDFWKYEHNIEDAGHEGHNWRYVTEDELSKLVKDCAEAHCFDDDEEPCGSCSCVDMCRVSSRLSSSSKG